MSQTLLHAQAQAEFEFEIGYYEAARPGWGGLLREEVLMTIRRLSDFPQMGGPEPVGTRKFVTRRFRFVVRYELMDNQILIWAIYHPAREPGHWLARRAP